jgi:hypothetical protein
MADHDSPLLVLTAALREIMNQSPDPRLPEERRRIRDAVLTRARQPDINSLTLLVDALFYWFEEVYDDFLDEDRFGPLDSA